MVYGTLLNFGKRYKDDLTAVLVETGAMPVPINREIQPFVVEGVRFTHI